MQSQYLTSAVIIILRQRYQTTMQRMHNAHAAALILTYNYEYFSIGTIGYVYITHADEGC